jgi:hypothetical protein
VSLTGNDVVCLLSGEEMLDRSLLPGFVDIDGRINRIRFSVDVLKMDQLFHKSLDDILGDSNNILSRADKFRVVIFLIWIIQINLINVFDQIYK